MKSLAPTDATALEDRLRRYPLAEAEEYEALLNELGIAVPRDGALCTMVDSFEQPYKRKNPNNLVTEDERGLALAVATPKVFLDNLCTPECSNLRRYLAKRSYPKYSVEAGILDIDGKQVPILLLCGVINGQTKTTGGREFFAQQGFTFITQHELECSHRLA